MTDKRSDEAENDGILAYEYPGGVLCCEKAHLAVQKVFAIIKNDQSEAGIENNDLLNRSGSKYYNIILKSS